MTTQQLKPFAFVLMPFDKNFDDIYNLGIKAVALDLGIIAERVDEQNFSERILERIYRQIHAADIVIADMTGKNSNVFYEVGYAHALDKKCTLLTQKTDDIPFDLKHHRHLIYDGSIQKLKEQLKPELSWLLQEIEKKRTSIFTVELKEIVADLEHDSWRTFAEVEIKLDIHNRSVRKSPEIEAIYFYTSNPWEFSINATDCASTEAPFNGSTGLKHFIKSPVNRLSPGAWAQLQLKGKKEVWNDFTGAEKKNDYRLKGIAKLEIVTSEGSFSEELHLDTIANDIPF
ncbi:MAG: nucleoside 2-deoxyribosyltransferase [Hyphomicrobiaceae bacterium]